MSALSPILQRFGRRARPPQLPLHGFDDRRRPVPFVDDLSDAQLERLNRLLEWQCFTVDGRGRRFGGVAWPGKRDTPQPIPDRRILLLDEALPLAGRTVLEIGCFEGVHTIALAERAASVVAVDARIDNVVKTIVRCALYAQHPTVFVSDLDAGPDERLVADVAFHVGVLYHLRDPIRHLRELGRGIRDGVLLDTHYAAPGETDAEVEIDGAVYRYRRYREGGMDDPFSGVHDHAKWLTLDDIVGLLGTSGFDDVRVVERRDERNGPRAMLLATRSAPAG